MPSEFRMFCKLQWLATVFGIVTISLAGCRTYPGQQYPPSNAGAAYGSGNGGYGASGGYGTNGNWDPYAGGAPSSQPPTLRTTPDQASSPSASPLFRQSIPSYSPEPAFRTQPVTPYSPAPQSGAQSYGAQQFGSQPGQNARPVLQPFQSRGFGSTRWPF